MTILDDIVEAKRNEVAALCDAAAALEDAARAASPVRPFAAALRGGPRMAVIAEIKRRSPSKGELAPDLDPAATARAYEAGGAAALSVLTDRSWFDGSLEDLRSARSAVELPVLRKDFTIDPIQVFEARAAGADAVLLIVGALSDDGLLAELHALIRELGMTPLVETDDERAVERALAVGADVVGITNRDLRTFDEDLTTAERLASLLPDDVVRVAESAIRGAADAARMARAGFDALLVGEHLVRSPDPIAALGALRVERRITERG